MIRVNLAKNRAVDPQAATKASAADVSESFEKRQNVVKGALLLMFLVVLIFMENQNLNSLRQEMDAVQSEVTTKEAEVAVKAKEVEAIKDIESQARELEDKLKILKLLSRLRLREVKTLDFMQSSIPEKVWLTNLNFEAERDRPEEGKFNFVGGASSTEDLTEFVKRLEDSSYLQEVIVIKNQETSSTGASKSLRREYNFTALVEAQP